MTWEQLARLLQARAPIPALELLVVVAVHHCGAWVTEVGRCVGKPAGTVSRWPSRDAQRRMTEEAFGYWVEIVKAKLRPTRRMRRAMSGSSAPFRRSTSIAESYGSGLSSKTT